MPTTRMVPSAGLEIAVREHSGPGSGRPTVVLVHGYPDRQQTWDPVVESLPPAELHIVTYDVRGAGASGVPGQTSDYRTELLLEDLASVLDAVLVPGEAAHLVGHDWGSVQLWAAVVAESSHPRLRGRIASFTSISGPSLDHSVWLARHQQGRRRRLLRQLGRSWYVAAFHVPVLPDLIWRHLHGPLGRWVAAKQGMGPDYWGPGLGHDAENGLRLYRANLLSRRMTKQAHTDVPVLVITPRWDVFVTDVFLDELDRMCSNLRVVEVAGGHWVTRTHPGVVANLILEQVRDR
ncbi:hypothetical protein BH18ACT9_BH18ACT9_19640 [soil metagenome]